MEGGFDWLEYTVFFAVLALSLFVGVYFRHGQDSVKEYLLGGRKMTVFPIVMSLVSSYISGIALIGLPTEIYSHGTQYIVVLLINFCTAGITLTVFLPVFYDLQLLSLYEYLEMRFNHSVRVFSSLLYALSLILYLPLVVYVPGLAFNQVSGINIHVICPLLSVVCIIYTSMGGLKAVVWTDAIQGALMLSAVLAVLAVGVVKAGGFQAIFEISAAGERLELFNMNPDPTVRLSFWSATLGFLFIYLPLIAVNPACMQRFNSLPTYNQAKLAAILFALGSDIIVGCSLFLGIVIYTVYNDCDPLSAQIINRADQILPYFVLDVAGHIRGLPGLFLVGICCAALSTLSTGLNTVGGTIYEDFVEPCLGKVSEKKASRRIKLIVVIAGVVCVALVSVVEKLGKIIEMTTSFGSVTSGGTLGIFVLGLLFPRANSKGALVGGATSLLVMGWIIGGAQVALLRGAMTFQTKPFTVSGCPNYTEPLSNVTETVDRNDEVWVVYRVSMFYYSLIGCTVVIVVGLLVSYLTEPPEGLKPELFSPIVRGLVKRQHKYQGVIVPKSKVEENGL